MVTLRRAFLSALLGALLLVAAACGGGTSPESNADPTAPAQEQTSDGAGSNAGDAEGENTGEQSTESPTEAPAQEETEENKTADINDIGGSLENLESYRLRFVYGAEGTDEQGEAQQGSFEILQEYVKSSNSRHSRWSTKGTLDSEKTSGKQEAFETFQIDGVSYMYTPHEEGDAQCVAFSSEQAAMPTAMMQPGDFIGGVENADLVAEGETVNGVVTDHYSFDHSDLAFGSFAAAKGDVWMAQDGGFVVKYVGEATGKDPTTQSEGTFRWEYHLEAVNSIEQIELPKPCEGEKPAGSDIPVPENAVDPSSLGGMLTFTSPDATADIAAFYTEQLTAQGWAAGEAESMGGMESLTFTKDGSTITVIIKAEDSGDSSVMVTQE